MQGARAPQPGATNRPSPSGPFTVPSAPDRSQECRFLERCAAPRAPCERHPPSSSPRRNAPRGPAALAAGAHPDPYRTRKLSRPAPMVLQGRPCGRLGRRRPPGRVARARGGEARERHLEMGTRESPFFRLWAFPAHKYYGLFLLFNRRFLSLMMDNFIFSLGLVVRTVDTSCLVIIGRVDKALPTAAAP